MHREVLPAAPAGDLELRTGDLIARLRPAIGGSLSGFWQLADGLAAPLLRAAPAVATSPLAMASFPLVPFCNRIEHGRFAWRGRQVVLAPNHAGDPFPLHGWGWYAAWELQERDAASAELVWRRPVGEWPWAFAARQRYVLGPDELRVELTLRSLADEPMPVGLGHHPYFPRSAATRLVATLPELLEVDERLIPVRRVPNPWRGAMAQGLPIATLRLDHAFGGWDGWARIEQPELGVAIELHGAAGQSFHLYVPEAPYFCAEAVTNEPNAVNAAAHALVPEASMHVLEPGGCFEYVMRLRVWRRAEAGG